MARLVMGRPADSGVVDPTTSGMAPMGTLTPDDRTASRSAAIGSDLDDLELGIEEAKIVCVRRQDSLTGATSADDDMSIDHVGCSGGRQQPSDVRGVHSVEGDDICVWLADQSGKPDLAVGSANRLSQCSCWHGDASASLGGASQQHDDGPILSVDSEQAPRVEGDTRRHAAERFDFLPVPRMRSAQDRSSSVRSPPVRLKASASNAPHPATSSSETDTAC
ncbi:MAG: hypothetical protein ACRD03_12340 [Acidimicrobiales bacterium]